MQAYSVRTECTHHMSIINEDQFTQGIYKRMRYCGPYSQIRIFFSSFETEDRA